MNTSNEYFSQQTLDNVEKMLYNLREMKDVWLFDQALLDKDIEYYEELRSSLKKQSKIPNLSERLKLQNKIDIKLIELYNEDNWVKFQLNFWDTMTHPKIMKQYKEENIAYADEPAYNGGTGNDCYPHLEELERLIIMCRNKFQRDELWKKRRIKEATPINEKFIYTNQFIQLAEEIL
jgi:hypothetical protein